MINETSPYPLAFETIRTYQGRPRALDQHLERLLNSMEMIHPHRIKGSLITKKNRTEFKSRLKDEINRELGHGGFIDQELIIRLFLSPLLEFKISLQDLDLSYVNCPRSLCSVHSPLSYDARAKHNDREIWTELAHRLDCDEILLCSSDERPLESNNANFWSLELEIEASKLKEQLDHDSQTPMRGMIWRTPQLNGDLLPGITRELLIPFFISQGARVIEEDLMPIKELSATTCGMNYLSSTLKSLSWVNQIDQHHFREPCFNQSLFTCIERYLSRC